MNNYMGVVQDELLQREISKEDFAANCPDNPFGCYPETSIQPLPVHHAPPPSITDMYIQPQMRTPEPFNFMETAKDAFALWPAYPPERHARQRIAQGVIAGAILIGTGVVLAKVIR